VLSRQRSAFSQSWRFRFNCFLCTDH
jgi:hypothetical protein